jgi:hypothetical protein
MKDPLNADRFLYHLYTIFMFLAILLYTIHDTIPDRVTPILNEKNAPERRIYHINTTSLKISQRKAH